MGFRWTELKLLLLTGYFAQDLQRIWCVKTLKDAVNLLPTGDMTYFFTDNVTLWTTNQLWESVSCKQLVGSRVICCIGLTEFTGPTANILMWPCPIINVNQPTRNKFSDHMIFTKLPVCHHHFHTISIQPANVSVSAAATNVIRSFCKNLFKKGRFLLSIYYSIGHFYLNPARLA